MANSVKERNKEKEKERKGRVVTPLLFIKCHRGREETSSNGTEPDHQITKSADQTPDQNVTEDATRTGTATKLKECNLTK